MASVYKKEEGKLTEKQQVVDSIFKPNEEGVSNWVERETLKDTRLDWGNNGISRHGIFFGDFRYKWEKRQSKGKIIALRTSGYNSDYLSGARRTPPRKDIQEFLRKNCWICVACAETTNLIFDHKNDLYNDPRVLNVKTQTIDDFQVLCTPCNLRKREVNKKTRKFGRRIGATTIPCLSVLGVDFTEGDETINFRDINAMKGTYWYDPVEFIKKALEIKFYHRSDR